MHLGTFRAGAHPQPLVAAATPCAGGMHARGMHKCTHTHTHTHTQEAGMHAPTDIRCTHERMHRWTHTHTHTRIHVCANIQDKQSIQEQEHKPQTSTLAALGLGRGKGKLQSKEVAKVGRGTAADSADEAVACRVGRAPMSFRGALCTQEGPPQDQTASAARLPPGCGVLPQPTRAHCPAAPWLWCATLTKWQALPGCPGSTCLG